MTLIFRRVLIGLLWGTVSTDDASLAIILSRFRRELQDGFSLFT
jgi:hypothetical protein